MAFYLIASPIPPMETVIVFALAMLLVFMPRVPRLARALATSVAGAAMLTAAVWCCCGWFCWVIFP